MKKIFIILFLMLISSPSSYAATEELPPLPNGPLILTSATVAMQNPDFWIRRIPNAEAPIKTPKQIQFFNSEIKNMVHENIDVLALDKTRPGKPIKDQLELEYTTLRNRKLMDSKNKPVPKSFFETEIAPRMQIDTVPQKIKVKFGVATKATDVRAIPTMFKMIEGVNDVEFDQLQYTLIKLWTPVAIYHTSADLKWVYVQAPYVRGWVRAKDIAVFDSREALQAKIKTSDFLTITGESVPVYEDSALTKTLIRPTMGTTIPLASKELQARSYVVWLPYKKEGGAVAFTRGFINRQSDVTRGFPAYSPANIIRQAFKLLGKRYGWGGQYNGRDCSGFTHDVFLSFGIDFPRDSKQQGMVGTQLGFFKPFEDEDARREALAAARPGLTLLRMPKHIMLYLGSLNGLDYVIHSTWAERTGDDPVEDKKNRINQVVVSDLELNGQSYLGSLFDRVISINEVD